MRTNIDIDEKLIREAMMATGTATKRAAVEACLRKLLEVHALETAQARNFRRRERERRAAIREGRLEAWYSELIGKENTTEAVADANQH